MFLENCSLWEHYSCCIVFNLALKELLNKGEEESK